jgi:hypothetical protein
MESLAFGKRIAVKSHCDYRRATAVPLGVRFASVINFPMREISTCEARSGGSDEAVGWSLRRRVFVLGAHPIERTLRLPSPLNRALADHQAMSKPRCLNLAAGRAVLGQGSRT